MEAKATLDALKTELDEMFSRKYTQISIGGEPFFAHTKCKAFRVVNLHPFRNAFVIEYADTWEDGSMFYPEDFNSTDELFRAMQKEIEA